MKKIIYLTVSVFVFTISNSFAQSNWSIGLLSYPKIDNRIIQPAENSQEYVDYRNDNETFNPGIDFGVNIQYRISDSWNVGSGLAYSTKSYRTVEHRLIDPCYSPWTCGFETEFYTYKFKSLQVPFHLIWNKKSDKLISYVFMGGISASYRFDNEVIYTLRAYSEGYKENELIRGFKGNIDAFDITADIGFGLNLGLTSNIDLRIMPLASFSLMPIHNEDIKNQLYGISKFVGVNKENKELLYSAGLSVSVMYNIFEE